MTIVFRLLLSVALIWAVLIGPRPAQAHPHVWIDTRVNPVFNAQGQVEAVHVIWRLDELYSQSSITDLETDAQGQVTAEALADLIGTAMVNLEEWYYFLDARQNGERAAFAVPQQFEARFEDGRLIYDFVLPFADPVDPVRAPLALRAFDPSLYIGIDLEKESAVTLQKAPEACRFHVVPPKAIPETLLMSEQTFGAVEAEPGTEGLGGRFAETVVVSCAS